jgi:hypothetical protein
MTDAATLQAAFADFRCDRMQRAWRNRSNVTRWAWQDRAAKAGDRTLAPLLYAACGELSPFGLFEPESWPAAHWATVAGRLPALLDYPPDKALSRGEYEARQNQPTPAEVCHKLYNALQVWATGKFTHRADVWRITRDAERAYRTLFPAKQP